MTRAEIQPSVLRWACDRSGRSELEIRKRFPQFDSWEDQSRRPTLRQARDFAAFTYAPFSCLFLDQPPKEEAPIADFRTLRATEPSVFSPHLLDTIYQCEWQQDWYRDYLQRVGASTAQVFSSNSPDGTPEQVATQVRGSLGLLQSSAGRASTWREAATDLRHLLEHAGVTVMKNGVVGNNTHRPLDPKEFRGFSLADPIAPLIFINGADTVAAQMFTTAHELGHLVRGERGVSNAQATTNRGRSEELWCNSFAAEFLVPTSEFLESIEDYTEPSQEVKQLARRFGVSTLVILRRLADHGVISGFTFRQRYREELQVATQAALNRSGSGSGGNFYATLVIRIGRRFARAVVTSVLEGQTSFTEGLDLLTLKKSESFYKLARHLGFDV